MSTITTAIRRTAVDQNARVAAGELGALIKCLALARGDGYSMALAVGEQARVTDRVKAVLRAAISAGSMTNNAAIADVKVMSDGFLGVVRSISAIQEIASSGGFRALPLRTRVGRVTTGATAYRVEELQSKPASKLAILDLGLLESIKIVVFVVVSGEVFRFGNAVANTVINEDLLGALAKRFDQEAIAELIDTGTPSAASTGDPLADIAFLTGNVSLSSASRPFFIGSSDAIKFLSLHAGSGGARSFEALGISGGELCGVPALVTDALTDELIFLDAAQVAFADDGVVPDVSTQSSIVLDDTGTGAAPVSLWQQNLVAPRLERTFGIASLGERSIARVTGIGAST